MYYIMKYKEFGNSGIKNSVIGMGTYYDPLWIVTARFGWLRDSEKKIQSLRAGLDAGINIIDTAELYGSEPLVKKALEGYERDKIFISTKVWAYAFKRGKIV
jgi:Predicted oxidoreductases (related to aryl-alcohol dehydrogenases)